MLRNCYICGAVDDHPRDVIDLGGGQTAYAHHDCHAAMDPPCPSCAWLVNHKGELVGDDWRAQVNDLHAQLSDEQLALAPWDRAVVKSHVNGKVAS